MKKAIHTFIIAVILVGFSACKNNSSQPEIKTETANNKLSNTSLAEATDSNASFAKVEFGIEGMTCAVGCAKSIEKKIAGMDGVKSAKVDFDKLLAMVEYDEAKVTHKSLEETVLKVSDVYKVKDMKQVDSFSTEKAACKPNCKKDCCKNKSEKQCSANCKKACCAKNI